MGKQKSKGEKKDKSESTTESGISQSFIDYYRDILVPDHLTEADFNTMIDIYKEPLPNVFRLSTKADNIKHIQEELNKILEDLKLYKIETVEYDSLPQEFGKVYRMKVDKTLLRKSPELEVFNKWLKNQTTLGHTHRQEFVSMIPPYFLDVKPDSSVLDCCAAPGSKSCQILEMLKEGFLVSNDLEPKRCHNLVHQMQRIGTENALITCQNAEFLDYGNTKFDRVLCDVPCSGDGTCRKNPSAAAKWNPSGGLQLHQTQRNILLRGLELLKVDGICVYSTCSMNPIEDEAVINSVINELNGAVEILDVSSKFLDLKRHSGISSWPVFNKEMTKYQSFENVSEDDKELIKETMFPSKIAPGLENCMRFYPQDDDSGGFFITVLKKVSEFERVTKEPTKPAKPLREAPFKCITEMETDAIKKLKDVYDISDELSISQLYVRDETKVHGIYYVNQHISNLVKEIGYQKLRVIHGGTKIFTIKSLGKEQKDIPCPAQEGIDIAFRFINKRKYGLTPRLIVKLLKAGRNGVKYSKLPEDISNQLTNEPQTGAIFYIPNTNFMYSGITFKFSAAIYLKNELVDLEVQKIMNVFSDLFKKEI